MKKIYAILPCYNEEENIGKLIEEWNEQRALLEKKQYELNIVAIDDYSTDNTKSVILEKKKIYKNVEIIEHTENKGLRGGLNSALHYFNQYGQKDDLLVLMDGDNTHNPKYIHSMLKLILEGKDCVIASRYQKGSNIVGLAKNRELMSDFAKLYYTTILNIPNVKDYTCGYRIYTYNIITKLLKKFGEEPIKEKSFACMMELLYKVYMVGAKFEEVGFELRYDNKCGKSKMNVFKTVRRSLITAIKLKISSHKTSLLCMIFLILFSIFLSLGTNFSPMNKNVLNHDSGIFSYVAFAMQKGRILYRDVWENKGPLLYFIYYFGFWINQKFGVYALELISIFISVLFSFKIIMEMTQKKWYAIIGVLYTFSVWEVTFEGGTFSESFALPILMIGVYAFIKQLKNNFKVQNKEIIFWGILSSLIALLRLNMLSIFLAFFIVIGVCFLWNRRWKEIFRWLGLGLVGFIITLLPFLLYFIYHHALSDCLNTAYFGILSGFNSGTLQEKLVVLWNMINAFNVSGTSILGLSFIITFFILLFTKTFNNKEYKIYGITVILAIIINLYANAIAGAYQMHYFLTFIPILPMILAFYFQLYDTIKLNYLIKVIIICLIVILVSLDGYENYLNFCEVRYNQISKDSPYKTISSYILNETKENDLVQMIGGRMEAVSANYRTKRLSASKYSYLPLWPSFTKERKTFMVNECVNEIYEQKPQLIFICQYNNNANEFYELIEEEKIWDEFLINNYIKDEKSIAYYVIYKRK